MLSEQQWKAFTARMKQLAEDCYEAQFKTPEALPRGYNSIAVGQYPSHIDFLLHDDPDERFAILKDQMEANGSTFMGLWFLSGCVPLLRGLEQRLAEYDDDAFAAEIARVPQIPGAGDIHESLDAVRELCLAQLHTARQLPKFYQGGTEEGTTQDIHQCPRYTMGWYPLVGKYRIPAVIRDSFERLLRVLYRVFGYQLLPNMSNLTDGDIWAWCLAIDDTTPGILEYFGEEVLKSHEIYKPLLGSHTTEQYGDLLPEEWLGEDSIRLLEFAPRQQPPGLVMSRWMGQETFVLLQEIPGMRLSHANEFFPIQTFYEPTKGPKGAFSCAVISNVLASIPTLGQPPDEVLWELETAALFVRTNARRALQNQISWRLYAYDYYTIRAAPVGYLLRAHRMIEELRRRKKLNRYPTLLDRDTLALCARFVYRMVWGILAKHPDTIMACDDGPGTFHGNEDYANLIYSFLSMMNIWAVDPGLFEEHFRPADQPREQQIVHQVADFLLRPSPDVFDTPGTGPYKVFDIFGFSIYAAKSSICFVLPPLLEAYAMYLHSELPE